MGFSGRIASFALMTTFMVLVSMPASGEAARIVVGGNGWHFGFNYSDWAIKAAPFFHSDRLVFMYDPPNSTTFPHSVYLLKDAKSFERCDLRHAKVLAGAVQGRGAGFEYMLKRGNKPYYFACGERNGFHCSTGMMKLAVKALPLICRG